MRSGAFYVHVGLVVAALGAAACSATPSADPLSGGSTTVFDATKGAYANAAPHLAPERLDLFNLGHALFNRNWVTAPATTDDIDGLGPIFNQRSCSGCHSRDGRSAPFADDGELLGMLFRLSIPGSDPHGGPLGDSIYATQLRPFGTLTVPGGGTPRVTYVETPGTYGDGTAYSLQTPSYAIDNWNYGQPAADLMLSPRMGPFVMGLGLLEAVPEATILSFVRSGDPDGVVGKPNYVWDGSVGATVLGRFGWKANVSSLLEQSAGAFNGDIGITSTLFPNEPCTPTMTACVAAAQGPQPDISDERLDAVVSYMQTLAVPARRDVDDKTALRGEKLFAEFGCTSCHIPTMKTTSHRIPEVENQTIHPYTDLLLHDMGPHLGDNRPDFLAEGPDWRTPPLWGIGLLQKVNGHELLLHDGRARGLAEAILWHGGEAEVAKERFRVANVSDREALLTFLRSL